MKIQNAFLALTLITFGANANASVLELKNCETEIVKEIFRTCPDGEAGSETACGSTTTALGRVKLDMKLDSDTSAYNGVMSVRDQATNVVKKSAIACVRGSEVFNKFYMTCTTVNPVLANKKLSLHFNVHRFEIGEELVFLSLTMPLGDITRFGIGSIASHLNCHR